MDAVSALVLICGAAGLILVGTSLGPLQSRRLDRRIEPYLHGLAGRPSRLLRPSSTSRGWLASYLQRSGLVGRPELRRRLEAAGKVPDEVGFRIEQLVWSGVGFALAGLLTTFATASGVAAASPVFGLVAIVSAATGALARDWFLAQETTRRHAALKAELPTAIDHMTLALLAGESIPGAFARVAGSVSGVVAAEFHRVGADIRGGATVIEALESFGNRIPDPAVARFVDALTNAVERGTSLAEVLRAQADDVREARRRQLMEMGGRREVLMLVPVVFLIMPVVVLFALYPGLVSLDLLVP